MNKNLFANTCIDYGNSFIINQNSKTNSPRFEIKSYCKIKNLINNIEQNFYQGPTMKSEITFGEKKLFLDKDNYNFTSVYGDTQLFLFRYGSIKVRNRYVDKRKNNIWGKIKIFIKEKKSRMISSVDDIFNNIMNGNRIIAKIDFEQNNFKVILEFPVETINCDYRKKQWQVDTGPVFFPSKIEKEAIYNPYLTYVAFNNKIKNYGLVNFIIEGDEKRKDKVILKKCSINFMVYEN